MTTTSFATILPAASASIAARSPSKTRAVPSKTVSSNPADFTTAPSGASEPFVREKAVAGVRKACKGRPVTEDQLACLGQEVEDALRTAGAAEIPAHEVGLAILGPLRRLDEVAYLRFASVYRAFSSAADFEAEIAMLRAEAVEQRGAPATSERRDHESDDLTPQPTG